MTELKRCPFCGGEAVVIEEYLSEEADASADEISYFVSCGLCASRTDNYATEEQAIEAWNNRPNPWHTGTPTKEGWYLCKTINSTLPPFTTDYFTHEYGWHYHLVADYIEWQKIEYPQEEEK